MLEYLINIKILINYEYFDNKICSLIPQDNVNDLSDQDIANKLSRILKLLNNNFEKGIMQKQIMLDNKNVLPRYMNSISNKQKEKSSEKNDISESSEESNVSESINNGE